MTAPAVPDPPRTVEIRWTCAYCGHHESIDAVRDDSTPAAVALARKSFRRHILAEHPEHAEDVA